MPAGTWYARDGGTTMSDLWSQQPSASLVQQFFRHRGLKHGCTGTGTLCSTKSFDRGLSCDFGIFLEFFLNFFWNFFGIFLEFFCAAVTRSRKSGTEGAASAPASAHASDCSWVATHFALLTVLYLASRPPTLGTGCQGPPQRCWRWFEFPLICRKAPTSPAGGQQPLGPSDGLFGGLFDAVDIPFHGLRLVFLMDFIMAFIMECLMELVDVFMELFMDFLMDSTDFLNDYF